MEDDPILANFKTSLAVQLRSVDVTNRGVEFYSENVRALMADPGAPQWLDVADLSEESPEELKTLADRCPNRKIMFKLLRTIKESQDQRPKALQFNAPDVGNKIGKDAKDLGIDQIDAEAIDLDALFPDPCDKKSNTDSEIKGLHMNWLPTSTNLSKAQRAKLENAFPNFSYSDVIKDLGLEYESEDSGSDAIDQLKDALKKKSTNDKLPKTMNSLLIYIEDISLSLVMAKIWNHGHAYSYRRMILEVGQQTKSTRTAALYDRQVRSLFVKVAKASKNIDWDKLTGEICQKSLLSAKSIEESIKSRKVVKITKTTPAGKNQNSRAAPYWSPAAWSPAAWSPSNHHNDYSYNSKYYPAAKGKNQWGSKRSEDQLAIKDHQES
jgi:hypothetical protein